jgi:murein DD-endopeptidase MepM/ murein hydrolase activator NlpD
MLALLCLFALAQRPSEITWRPRVPLEGSLVILVVRSPDDSLAAMQGTLAGEALHFERTAGRRGGEEFHALGAVPFGGTDSVPAQIVEDRSGGVTDTVTVSLAVRRRRVPGELLRVAPEFAEPPDSLAARIQTERKLLDDVRQRAHDTPRMWRMSFERPRPGPITSVFGVPRVLNGTVRSRHYGVDFAGQMGASVRAANRGVVALVADLYYSGTTVIIDHGAGLLTGYFHLSRVLVAQGDTIERGQPLGRVGASGRVTRPHLHWFGAYGRVTVDPLDLLKLEPSLEWQGSGKAKARRTDAQR